MIDEFKTISNQVGEGYYTEKRSKFLAFAHHVTSVEEVKDIVASYRKKYYDARHCCYAYMLDLLLRQESLFLDKSTKKN